MSDNQTDIAVAKHLFDRIDRMRKHDLPGFNVWRLAAGEFHSDLVLSAPRPSGGVNILLGDFVGRGLPAAVGALPVAEVFYGMTDKGFGLSDIIEEINKKLLFILPEGLFCTACLIELEQEGKMLAVWNGGLPDLLVIDSSSKIKHRISSSHVPLGIAPMDKSNLETAFIEVSAGDTIFSCSGGLINSENSSGELFGQDSVDTVLMRSTNISALSDAITTHINNAKQIDDITILELNIEAVQNYEFSTEDDVKPPSFPPAQWQVDFDFSAQVLQKSDLVPLLINIVMQIQAPHEHKQRIYTVLAEMCSNALEHGLLELESSLKESADGFAEYYGLRTQRLADLDNAYMKISLHHEPYQEGGKLSIRVEDSGKGFDYKQHKLNLSENKSLCGRGEGLIQQLCSEYFFSGLGNSAHAVYLWAA